MRRQILIPLFCLIFFLSLLSPRYYRAPWYEQWLLNVLHPFSWLATAVQESIGDLSRHYFFLVGTSKENEKLGRELRALERQLASLNEIKGENERLVALLALKENFSQGSVAARVIGFDPRSEIQSLTINKGAKEGLMPLRPVVAVGGLVGRVGPVFSHSAKVLLLIDPNSSVDVIFAKNRGRGLAMGESGGLRVEFVKEEWEIGEGELILTSGLDGFFPKGIPVGEVKSYKKTGRGVYEEIQAKPLVDFHKLEEVLVLTQHAR